MATSLAAEVDELRRLSASARRSAMVSTICSGTTATCRGDRRAEQVPEDQPLGAGMSELAKKNLRAKNLNRIGWATWRRRRASTECRPPSSRRVQAELLKIWFQSQARNEALERRARADATRCRARTAHTTLIGGEAESRAELEHQPAVAHPAEARRSGGRPHLSAGRGANSRHLPPTTSSADRRHGDVEGMIAQQYRWRARRSRQRSHAPVRPRAEALAAARARCVQGGPRALLRRVRWRAPRREQHGRHVHAPHQLRHEQAFLEEQHRRDHRGGGAQATATLTALMRSGLKENGFQLDGGTSEPIKALIVKTRCPPCSAGASPSNFKSEDQRLGDVMYKYPRLPPFYIAVKGKPCVLEVSRQWRWTTRRDRQGRLPVHRASRLLTAKRRAPRLHSSTGRGLPQRVRVRGSTREGLLEPAADRRSTSAPSPSAASLDHKLSRAAAQQDAPHPLAGVDELEAQAGAAGAAARGASAAAPLARCRVQADDCRARGEREASCGDCAGGRVQHEDKSGRCGAHLPGGRPLAARGRVRARGARRRAACARKPRRPIVARREADRKAQTSQVRLAERAVVGSAASPSTRRRGGGRSRGRRTARRRRRRRRSSRRSRRRRRRRDGRRGAAGAATPRAARRCSAADADADDKPPVRPGWTRI